MKTRGKKTGNPDNSQERLASFPRLNPNPVIELDSSGDVVYCNPAVERLMEDFETGRAGLKELLPPDISSMLQSWDQKHEKREYREVSLRDRAFAEAIYFVPQYRTVRIYAFEITDRRRAEEELRRSEERFRGIAETSEDIIFRMDTEGRFTYCSPAIRRYGYEPDNLLGRSFEEFLPESEMAAAALALKRVISGEMISLFEIDVLRSDGTIRSCEVSATPLAEKGIVTGLQGMARDITHRKQAEETMRQGREDLDRAQEVGQIGWWRMDTIRNVLTWSDENYRIFEIPKGAPLTYETFLSTVHPDDRVYVDRRWKAALEGEDYDLEHRIVSEKGTKWVREKAYLEFDENRTLLGGFGITQDITRRKEAEEALQRSERRYRSFIEVTNEWSWVTDPEGKVVEDLPAFRAFTGQTYEQSKGTGWANTLHPDDLKRTLEVWNRAVKTGSPYESEYRMRRHDGAYRLMLAKGVPIIDEQGSVIEWVGTCIDITERREAEEAIIRHAAELAARNEELARFNRAAVDRELRMMELKKEVNRLLRDAGQEPRYTIGSEDEQILQYRSQRNWEET